MLCICVGNDSGATTGVAPLFSGVCTGKVNGLVNTVDPKKSNAPAGGAILFRP